jgi:LL-diaminopimelate aminotransferase
MALLNRVKGLKKINIFQEILLKASGIKEVVSLAVGDNPGPIPKLVIDALIEEAKSFGTIEGHKGYPPEEGLVVLKELINEVFYNGRFSPEEIFISDGIKTDLFRLQTLFGPSAVSSYFAPGYPTYKEGCEIIGAKTVPIYLDPEKGFVPDVDRVVPFDVFYLCSPNNPTGIAMDKDQIEAMIDKARTYEGLIVHDACYSPYIQTNKPKTIFLNDEALKFAVELGSFSKWAAFSGIRLSWAVIPKEVKFRDGSSLLKAYTGFLNATYNGVSWLSQKMGCTLLKNTNLFFNQIDSTMQRVQQMKELFQLKGFEVYGGVDGPYFLVKTQVDFLEKFKILTLPLTSFEPDYEGFIRVSGFISEKNWQIVTSRLQNSF